MPRLKIPEKAGAKCMLHIFCAREPQHALTGAICWPGIFPRGIFWPAFGRFPRASETTRSLKDFAFLRPPFSNFRRCAALFHKKESRCAGQNPRFEALPSDHFGRNFCFFKRSQKSNVFPKGEKTGPKKRLFRGVSLP